MHILILFASYAIFSLVLLSLIRRFQLVPSYIEDLKIFSVCLVIAPIGLAFCYGTLLRIFPMQSHDFYFYSIMLPLLALGAMSFREVLHVKSTLGKLPLNNKLLILLGLMGLVSIAFVNSKIPIYGNDPLEYFTVARAIFENQRLAGIYPLISEEIASGFYAPWTHPPGFVLTIAWAFVAQGSAGEAGVAKFINIFYLFALLSIVYAWSDGPKKQLGLMAGLLILISPIIVGETFEHHVDVGRIGLLTACLCLITVWLSSANTKFTVFLGLIIGLAIFVHSAGVLIWFLFVGLLLFIRDIPFSTRIFQSTLLIAVSVCVVSLDLISNYLTFGYIIGDKIAIWEISDLGIADYLNEQRGISSFYEKFQTGTLKPIIDLKVYGFSGLSFLIMGLLYLTHLTVSTSFNFRRILRHLRSADYLNVYFLLNIGFMMMVLLSAAFDSNSLVKNVRYLSSMIALQSIFAVLALDRLLPFAQISNKHLHFFSLVDDVSKRTFTITGAEISKFLLRLRFKRFPSQKGEPVLFVLLKICLVLFLLQAAFANIRLKNRDAHVFATGIYPGDNYFIEYLSNSPLGGFNIVGLLNQSALDYETPPNLKVLSFRPADSAYYGLYKQMPYTDPRLVPAFLARDPAQLFKELSELEVTHIIVPNYKMGEIEKTTFKEFLELGRHTVLVSQNGAFDFIA